MGQDRILLVTIRFIVADLYYLRSVVIVADDASLRSETI